MNFAADSVPHSGIAILSLLVSMLAVIVGPLMSLWVARRQTMTVLSVTHKQVIGPMRQRWIESLRDRVAELISLGAWFYRINMEVDPPASPTERQGQTQKLVFLIAQIELMLNPGEGEHQELVSGLEQLRATAVEPRRSQEFPQAVRSAKECCQRILKAEWERVKREN